MRKFNVTVNGKQYMVEVEEVGGTAQAVSAPVAAAPQAVAAPKAAAAPVAGTKVVAPMPGLVLGFKVSDGATV